MPLLRPFPKALVLSAFFLLPTAVAAQDSAVRLVAEPEAATLQVGAALPIAVRVVDADGETVALDLRFAAPRTALRFRDGVLQVVPGGGLRAHRDGGHASWRWRCPGSVEDPDHRHLASDRTCGCARFG